MVFYNNGVVVQDIGFDSTEFTDSEHRGKRSRRYLAYRGLGRYNSWPLIVETGEQQLIDEANKKWWGYFRTSSQETLALGTVPERDYCIRYINHCRSKGIVTRLLFCRTEIEWPIWDSPFPSMKFLGYDYSGSQSFNEIIPDDLLFDLPSHRKYGLEMQRLFECAKYLNKNQLFNTESDIREYIRRKQIAIAAGNDFEDDSDSVIFHVSEITGDI
jgi:hypothetical protein